MSKRELLRVFVTLDNKACFKDLFVCVFILNSKNKASSHEVLPFLAGLVRIQLATSLYVRDPRSLSLSLRGSAGQNGEGPSG
jgi:hypothetical protein